MRGSIPPRAAWLAPTAFLSSCGEGPATAMRAAAVVALLALAAAVVRRHRSPRRSPAALELEGRAWLGRDSGVAVVRARGESLLVGFGRDGVRLLSRLGRDGRP